MVGETQPPGRLASASFAFGFPPADIAECGPAVIAYAENAALAEMEADRLIGMVNAAEI